MSLITLGLNHKTAPVAIRERLAVTPERLPEALNGLIKVQGVSEAAILSTCNRTELYCTTTEQNDNPIIQWFSRYQGIDADSITGKLYHHNHESTVRHAMEVASGLDSMVLGEPQILGQMKQAFADATKSGTIGRLLGKLFQQSFTVAKQVRTDTSIGASPVSVAFAAVSLAKQIFGNPEKSTAMLIGAGETIELAARHLHAQGIKHIIVANRSIEKAQKLADAFNGQAINLQQIADHLYLADILISSTASPLPILGKGTVERALKQRKHNPIFMVDIAVPRDVEPEVGSLDDVYLYTVDDLQQVIETNMKSRVQAATQARDIIDIQVEHFLSWERSLDTVDIVSSLRDSVNSIKQETLDKALRQLQKGDNPEEVLQQFAHSLTNKFLHNPSVQLRKAGEDERDELVNAARALFLRKD